jgi:alpha-galactosidase/6-phospho-beta-glucosidase family protein
MTRICGSGNMTGCGMKSMGYIGRNGIGTVQRALQTGSAADVIEAMWTGNRKPYYVNTLNGSAVKNLRIMLF